MIRIWYDTKMIKYAKTGFEQFASFWIYFFPFYIAKFIKKQKTKSSKVTYNLASLKLFAATALWTVVWPTPHTAILNTMKPKLNPQTVWYPRGSKLKL